MPYRPHLFATLALTLLLLIQPQAPAQAAPPPAPVAGNGFAYFEETGHNIGGQIKRYFDAHGGVAVFGLPLTEMFIEDGLAVQYFEHARFELHSNPTVGKRVELTRLGALLTEGRSDPAFQWLAASPNPDRTFFPESGHSVGGAFGWYWESRGGIAAFGYPISEEFYEISPLDGREYLVQYFERARFEYRPNAVGNEVQPTPLGRQLLNQRPVAQAQTARVPRLVLLGSATTGFTASAAERELNIAQSSAMFDGVVVASGEEYSFLNSGDFDVNANFVEGYAIVGGRLEKVIGGGLCQVSTTMFRAVSNAGLEVTRRQGHTYVVYFYENILGFDATVFSPSLDFRWRNDTPYPVYMVTSTNLASATNTFEIWGVGDGRTTSYRGPFISNVVQPSRPTWQYDPTLPEGRTSQLVHGRAGMEVNYYRTVTMPNGTVKHNNNFYTRYLPWEDFYTYGPGVTPPAGVNVIGARR